MGLSIIILKTIRVSQNLCQRNLAKICPARPEPLTDWLVSDQTPFHTSHTEPVESHSHMQKSHSFYTLSAFARFSSCSQSFSRPVLCPGIAAFLP